MTAGSDTARCHDTLYRSELVTITNWRCHGVDMHSDTVCRSYEVIVVRHGAFVRRSEGRDTLADAGTVSLWRPGEIHRISHPLSDPDRCCSFTLPTEVATSILEESAPELLESRVRRTRTTTIIPGVLYLLHRRVLRDAASPDCAARLEERALAFVGRALRLRQTGIDSARAADYANRVRAVIAERFDEPLSLSMIAKAVCCSPYHLSRSVKAAEGQTIHEMLLRIRLRAALEWLLETREDVASIAFRVGFSSHSHLSAAFRCEYGLTPTQARSGMRDTGHVLRARLKSPAPRFSET